MRPDTIHFPDVRDEQDQDSGDRCCVYCDCQPVLTFCGKYVPGEEDCKPFDWNDETVCRDCMNVALLGRCPYCLSVWQDPDV